ncbi:MAG: hypothetical protein GEV09_20025 [Pseudonocardiaceae bacterium]|nr:hypothetical protein [Pseudonocardiaceae bacterium]
MAADAGTGSTTRRPVDDPTLGIEVDVAREGSPHNRLVSIGDSLTHGFQSGAVFNTDLSYSAIVAHELGWPQLRYPVYAGPGGLPLNIELLLRELADRFGGDLDWWEVPPALFAARQFADRVEDYWERGPGAAVPVVAAARHVLAVYGWDLRDALQRNAARAMSEVETPSDEVLDQLVSDHAARAALRVLPNATTADRERTVFDAAARLGEQGGIETLVVWLGANNALGTVTRLRVAWSGPGYDDLERNGAFTIWRPEHFAAELDLVAAEVEQIRARHVIWCTVPHVTIAPLAHGVGVKPRGSRYFPHYTRPWIAEGDFEPRRDPHITAAQARSVDSAIDRYNEAIERVVAGARRRGRDWYLCDIAGVVDRLATRRYLEDPSARPDWWTPYPLPPELAALHPVPDTRFLTTVDGRRAGGGLFSLDGVHPTTVGYGILAQELIAVMERAGVAFNLPDGTRRPSPVRVDFDRLIRRDTLLTRPPANLTSGLGVLSWADEALDLLGLSLPF